MLIVFKALLCMFLGTSVLALSQTVDRPSLKLGDSWVYQITDMRNGEKRAPVTWTVARLDPNQRQVFIQARYSLITFTDEWNHIRTVRGDTETETSTPTWGRFQFPLEVGKQWESRFDTLGASGRGFRWRFTVKVVGFESITVPAGTFDAFKLQLDGWYTCSAGCNYSSRRIETFWYAPAAKREIKSELENVAQGTGYRDVQRRELLLFTPGE